MVVIGVCVLPGGDFDFSAQQRMSLHVHDANTINKRMTSFALKRPQYTFV